MEDVIKKIQKLLSLATSSNKHEAEVAASKAQELLVRHNLNLQQVIGAQFEYDHDSITEFTRFTCERRLVLSLIGKYFFVKTIRVRKEGKMVVNMVGTKVNCMTAQYVHDFLLQSFNRLWQTYKKETGASVKEKQSFFYGVYEGLSDQLKQKRQNVETEMGLVVVEDSGLAKRYSEIYPKVSSRSHSYNVGAPDAREAGREEGKNLKISRAVTSTNNGKVLALA